MSEPKSATKLYAYALIKHDPRADLSHVKPVAMPEAHVFCLPLGKLAAVVSEIDQDEIMSTRRNMLTHTKALEDIMNIGAILPFSFGTIVEDAAALEALVRGQESRLLADLAALDGFIEVGVRATWDETIIFKEIVEESPQLRRLAEQIKTRPATETYYDRIELGRQVEAIMKAKRDAEARDLTEKLSAIATKSKILNSSSEMIVLEGAFLVAAAREKELLGVLEEAERKSPDRFSFKYLSPVPPYNFVSLKFAASQLAAA
jgi:hypothetical protein